MSTATILFCLASLPALWVFFLAYSALLANWKALRPEVKFVGCIVIAIGFVIDLGWNWSFGLVLGVTPDLTLSQKCGRLKYGEDWRAPVACYLCRSWLDPFQQGGHCR